MVAKRKGSGEPGGEPMVSGDNADAADAANAVERRSPIVGMEIVDRPATGSKNTWQVDSEADAIAKTVQTPGKAVRLAFRNIQHIVKIQMALRGRVAKHGLIMRYKTDPENRLVCWAERAKEKEKKT